MKKYIALLRGINVGGKNPVSMAKLKACFETNNFSHVKTYINSGNIIFSSEIYDEVKLKEICEQIISAEFNLNISVAIISAEDLEEALDNAPEWWGEYEEAKHNAIFVIYPATVKDIMEHVHGENSPYEKVASFGQVIFWSAPIETFSKVRWIKIVSSAAYQSVTIRNSNTAKKLLSLVRQ